MVSEPGGTGISAAMLEHIDRDRQLQEGLREALLEREIVNREPAEVEAGILNHPGSCAQLLVPVRVKRGGPKPPLW